MLLFNIRCILCIVYLSSLFNESSSNGILLLYRPLEVTDDCANSGQLKYDLSYGMGMSDTITIVFRAISTDYACFVEIAAMWPDTYLIMVVRYPTSVAVNCEVNADAVRILYNNKTCFRPCDVIPVKPKQSTYFVLTSKGRIVFRFFNNSSVNADIDANMYQVTVTAARLLVNETKCSKLNESLCNIENQAFCYTSGVVCDGVKHCGVNDWFDERKRNCNMPVAYLPPGPVIAVVAALVFIILACGHILLRCLPPLTRSYFIFSANEDNRLYIDPVFQSPIDRDSDETKRTSSPYGAESRSSTVKGMTNIIHDKIRFVTGRSRKSEVEDIDDADVMENI